MQETPTSNRRDPPETRSSALPAPKTSPPPQVGIVDQLGPTPESPRLTDQRLAVARQPAHLGGRCGPLQHFAQRRRSPSPRRRPQARMIQETDRHRVLKGHREHAPPTTMESQVRRPAQDWRDRAGAGLDQAARDAARRTECVNKVKQISLALHNHHSAHGSLPH